MIPSPREHHEEHADRFLVRLDPLAFLKRYDECPESFSFHELLLCRRPRRRAHQFSQVHMFAIGKDHAIPLRSS
jgi:hypothetical protein